MVVDVHSDEMDHCAPPSLVSSELGCWMRCDEMRAWKWERWYGISGTVDEASRACHVCALVGGVAVASRCPPDMRLGLCFAMLSRGFLIFVLDTQIAMHALCFLREASVELSWTTVSIGSTSSGETTTVFRSLG